MAHIDLHEIGETTLGDYEIGDIIDVTLQHSFGFEIVRRGEPSGVFHFLKDGSHPALVIDTFLLAYRSDCTSDGCQMEPRWEYSYGIHVLIDDMILLFEERGLPKAVDFQLLQKSSHGDRE